MGVQRDCKSKPGKLLFKLSVLQAILIAALFISGAFTLNQIYKKAVLQNVLNSGNLVYENIRNLLDIQSDGLSLALEAIITDPQLTDALRRKDRESLLKDWNELYIRLKARYNIVHLSFYDNRRICLLRFNDPGFHGDVSAGKTILKAKESGKTVSGIELGSANELTLRTVKPVYKENELAGYVELGIKLGDILKRKTFSHNNHVIIMLKISELYHGSEYEDLLVLSDDYVTILKNHIVIYTTLDKMSDQFLHTVDSFPSEKINQRRTIYYNDPVIGGCYMMIKPLRDVSDQEIGSFLIVSNICSQMENFDRTIFLVVVIGSAILVIILILLSVYIYYVDRSISEQQTEFRRVNEIVDKIEVGFCIFEPDNLENPKNFALIYSNPAAVRITGLKTKDFDKKDLRDLLPGDCIDIVEKNSLEVISRGEMRNFECSFTDKHPYSKVFYSIKLFKIHDTCLGMAFEDITTLKKGEDTLKKFKLIAEQSPASIVITDLTGEIKYVNKKFTDVTGYTNDEVIGQNPRVLKSGYTPPEKYRELWETIASGKEWRGEFQNKKKNGELYWELASISPLRDAEGKITNYLGVKENITLRKEMEISLRENEARIRAISESAQDAIIMMDHEGRTSFWNKAAEMIFGFTKEEMLGSDLHKILAPAKYYDNFLKAFERFKIDGKGDAIGKTLELEALCKCGREIPVELSLSSIKIKNRWNAVGIIRDITARKKTEEALKRAKEEAESASRAKSGFLANMSHEIRTPFNSVIGFSELLRNTPLSPSQKQYVENIHTSAESLLNIINDILDISKIESGKLELEIIRVDLIDLIEKTSDLIQLQAEKKRVEFIVNTPFDLPRFIEADPIRLKQILINLLSNAVKFTSEGEVELKLEFSPIDSYRGKFTFFVRDTGVGISEEQSEKIFSSFSQADSSTTRKFGGTGLGLAIANLLAEKMGAKIELHSIIGQGSTFYFSIRTSYEYDDSTKSAKVLPVKKALIVDDNENNSLILEEYLKIHGVNVVSCSSGPAALDLLKTNKTIELAIIDYQMPLMNGLETISNIRDKIKLTSEQLPIILMYSSLDDHTLRNSNLLEKIQQKISKPVKFNQLTEAIKKIFDNDDKINQGCDVVAESKLSSLSEEEFIILIAEDNILNKMLIKKLISNLLVNAVVIEVENGREAIKAVENNRIDLVLMDVQMPDMDGLEATEAIRRIEKKMKKHTPIIALTAGALKEEIEKCFKAGMDEYVPKPIRVESLKKVLKLYLLDRVK